MVYIPTSFEPEHRQQFRPATPDLPHVVVSGNVLTSDDLGGIEDETKYSFHEVHLVVGPWFKSVRSVVPFVTINGFINSNADDDDEQGWHTKDLTWDTVGGTGPNAEEERIRLKLTVAVRGEDSTVRYLAYYLLASGELGEKGITSPPPVHSA